MYDWQGSEKIVKIQTKIYSFFCNLDGLVDAKSCRDKYVIAGLSLNLGVPDTIPMLVAPMDVL